MSKGIIFRNHQNEKIYPCPFYPIGSVYISFSSTNPSTYFGGTWIRITGRFLLSADDSTYKVNNTGGSATHQHTLSSKGYAEISLHNSGEIMYHELNNSGGVTNWTANFRVVGSSGGSISKESSWGASLGGKTEAGSNLPPYIVVYMWRRTA